MDKATKTRLARLEAAQREPEPHWSIGFDIVDGWREEGGGRVVASIEPRLIQPGEEFDYTKAISELYAAMGGNDAQEL